MTAATQLSIYNGCLRVCKDKSIADLTVVEERRYVLDEIWADNFVQGCLEKGNWKFAKRDVSIAQTASPTVGWQYSFPIPSDLRRFYMVSADNRFNRPLIEHTTGNGKILANIQTIYVSYISDDAAYGLNYALWPEAFRDFVHHEMAIKAIGRLTGANADEEEVYAKHKIAKRDALNNDAMRDPSKFMAEPSWPAARRGRGVRSQNPSDFF